MNWGSFFLLLHHNHLRLTVLLHQVDAGLGGLVHLHAVQLVVLHVAQSLVNLHEGDGRLLLLYDI